MALNKLEQAIIRTLVYFDLLDYPLTATEIWKFLYNPDLPAEERTLNTIRVIVEDSPALQQYITRVEGFYCLRGREALIPERKNRNKRADYQIKKVVKYTKLLRLFPAIRMVAIASSLPLGNVNQSSDIDLVIIAKKNCIWLARFFSVGLMKIFRQRPTKVATESKFCLSFFITEDALNVENVSSGHDDIVFHYFLMSLMPIYDPDMLYVRFIKENEWLLQTLPQASAGSSFVHEVGRPAALKVWHRIFEFATWPLFNSIYRDWYCQYQLKIMPHELKSLANIDSRVIISDTMLKLHTNEKYNSLKFVWREIVKTYE